MDEGPPATRETRERQGSLRKWQTTWQTHPPSSSLLVQSTKEVLQPLGELPTQAAKKVIQPLAELPAQAANTVLKVFQPLPAAGEIGHQGSDK